MLKFNNLTKIYGDKILLDSVSFSINSGDRLGFIGRNGTGKSTLFKLILGQEQLDEGDIIKPRDYRIGHLAQHLNFTEYTILEEACLGLHNPNEEYKAKIILSGLGFDESDFYSPPSSFSGGYQIRLNLAKLLLAEPDMLLLDEPTNYLDIVSMKWLASFLRNWKSEFIIISHDKSFMDSVTNCTMIVHRSKIIKIPGTTSKLYQQITQDEEIYEKTRVNEEKRKKELEEFIARFRAQASKAALVQSKIKLLEKMGTKEELMDIETLDFKFREQEFVTKQMMEVKNISFGYTDPLISNFSFEIKKGDKICIIGKNGKGKSTLLRLLASELSPTSGSISKHQNTKIGYFGQTNIDRLNNNITIEEEIFNENITLTRTQVRNICGTMMFSGDDALKKISVLSGGEKSRVLLGKIVANPTNLLLLDEPTNHLDQESIETLIESIHNYSGATIIVTHSELILSKVANKIILFRGETPEFIDGDYDYFLSTYGWDSEVKLVKERAKKKNNPSKIEKKISDLEIKIQTLNDRLAVAYQQDKRNDIEKINQELDQENNRLSRLYEEWEAHES